MSTTGETAKRRASSFFARTKVATPEETTAVAALMRSLPEDATALEYIAAMRQKLPMSPWEMDALPPGENEFDVERGLRPQGLVEAHYESCFDHHNKGWAIELSERGQPLKKITGIGYAELPQDIRARQEWFATAARPLIARCPAGSANPGGWVRCVDSLPRSGRHYWEAMYTQGPTRRRGDPLTGVFMTGVVSNARLSFEWNSGIRHFWGVGSGRWRSDRRGKARAQRGVIVESGWVRNCDGLSEWDEEEGAYDDDDVLNASGAVYGHGEHVGVLVDMDEGFVAL